MGFVKKAVGGLMGGHTGYQSPYTKEMDTLLKERLQKQFAATPIAPSSAFGGKAGQTGTNLFGLREGLTAPVNAPKLNLPGYKATSYNPYQFSVPGALQQKGGLFGQLLGRTGSELQRAERGTSDAAMRQMQRTGAYSPAAFAQMAREGQRGTQEQIEKMGEQGAFDIASEQARADQAMQAAQAAENYQAAGFGRDEARYMAERDMAAQKDQAALDMQAKGLDLEGLKAALQGELGVGELQFKDVAQQQQFLSQLMDQLRQSYIQPYATPKTPSPFQQSFGAGLGNVLSGNALASGAGKAAMAAA